jgi:hypothetical protein
MRDYAHELLDRAHLFGLGFSLLFVGTLFWFFPRIYGRQMILRSAYAQRLRDTGENNRADKIDSDSDALNRRTPVYGKVIIIIGILVLTGMFFVK